MAIASVTKVLVASDGVTVGAVSFPLLPVDPAKVVARYRLSPTQLRVAVLLAARLTNSEIADCLGITVGTVRKHSEWVYCRTNVSKREDLAYILAACCHDPPVDT
jgi:DNA-binding CsgD family transcriptional regulator